MIIFIYIYLSLSCLVILSDGEFFANMVVDAVSAVKTVKSSTGLPYYPVTAINVLKAHGKSATDSRLVSVRTLLAIFDFSGILSLSPSMVASCLFISLLLFVMCVRGRVSVFCMLCFPSPVFSSSLDILPSSIALSISSFHRPSRSSNSRLARSRRAMR